MIKAIIKVEIVKYVDNGQRKAYVSWVDHKNKTGTTEGSPSSLHMRELIKRARREKVKIERDTRGWLPGG
jgi:hypothetical protein